MLVVISGSPCLRCIRLCAVVRLQWFAVGVLLVGAALAFGSMSQRPLWQWECMLCLDPACRELGRTGVVWNYCVVLRNYLPPPTMSVLMAEAFEAL